ncbi:hypothetical protein DENSPDRAFT_691424 [Dentipellis sp. KUC8613]|nr:hypothetical protein DENSPDRAFT_691424 [Dentipellis sp. KUC8613]
MAAPNFFPSYTVRSANTSSVVVRRRPKVPPKGSLPVFSRPRVYRPTPKRAVPTTYPVKGNPRGKGAEGVISRRHGVDDETQRILKESEALGHELREDTQGILDFWREFTERMFDVYSMLRVTDVGMKGASHLQQQMEDVMEDADRDSERVQGIVREELGKVDKIMKNIDKAAEDYDRQAIEHRRISKAQDQRIHEAQVEYRELRRDGRRAGLR